MTGEIILQLPTRLVIENTILSGLVISYLGAGIYNTSLIISFDSINWSGNTFEDFVFVVVSVVLWPSILYWTVENLSGFEDKLDELQEEVEGGKGEQ